MLDSSPLLAVKQTATETYWFVVNILTSNLPCCGHVECVVFAALTVYSKHFGRGTGAGAGLPDWARFLSGSALQLWLPDWAGNVAQSGNPGLVGFFYREILLCSHDTAHVR